MDKFIIILLASTSIVLSLFGKNSTAAQLSGVIIIVALVSLYIEIRRQQLNNFMKMIKDIAEEQNEQR